MLGRFCRCLLIGPALISTGLSRATSLADLADLRLGQQGDIARDLAEHRRDAGQRGAQVDDPQPVRVPGQYRHGQAEFGGEQRGDPLAGFAERGERARRAAELDREPRTHRIEPGAGLVQAGQPAGCDQSEGHGDGLLEQGPADHDRVPVRGGQPGRGVSRPGQVGRDDVDGPLGQQHRGGVHDVLAGGPAVNSADRGLGYLPRQRAGQPGHRIPGQGGESAQFVRIKITGPGRRGDRLARPGRRQPRPLERPGQPRLGVQHRLQPRGVVRLDAAPGENPAEQAPRVRLLMIRHPRSVLSRIRVTTLDS